MKRMKLPHLLLPVCLLAFAPTSKGMVTDIELAVDFGDYIGVSGTFNVGQTYRIESCAQFHSDYDGGMGYLELYKNGAWLASDSQSYSPDGEVSLYDVSTMETGPGTVEIMAYAYDTATDASCEWSYAYVEAVADITPIGPLSSLSIAASTASGQGNAIGSGSMTVYLGESISISSTATAPGWLSEHNMHGYTPGPSLFSIPNSTAMLAATATTTMSARTVTWTPSNSGIHTIYAEAFTGAYPGDRQYGLSGWPGYAGGLFGGLADKRITMNVRNNPTGSVQVLDATGNLVALSNGSFSITCGDTFYVRVNGSDQDGDAERYYSRLSLPNGTAFNHKDDLRDSGNGNNGSRTFGPYTAHIAGNWQIWGHVSDATARAWGSTIPWNENANGWYTSPNYVLQVIDAPVIQPSDVISQNATITLGYAFNPQIQGGSGTGQYQFKVNGQTNWQSSPWTPSTAGTFQFNVKRLGDATYQEKIGSITYTLTVTAPVNAAAFIAQSVPSTLMPGQTATVSVTMKNTGNTTWNNNSPCPYSLGSQNPQNNNRWALTRVGVGGTPVQPGETKTFTFTITAPATPGNYNFQWLMVQDGVEWFGASTPNLTISTSMDNMISDGTLHNNLGFDANASTKADTGELGADVYTPAR